MKGRNFIFSKLGECDHTVLRIVSNMFLRQKFDRTFKLISSILKFIIFQEGSSQRDAGQHSI
jgi:hypothetical protein